MTISTEMASKDMPSSAASSHSALFIWVDMLLVAFIMAFIYISLHCQSNHNLHTKQAFSSRYSKNLYISFYLPPSSIKVTRQALFHPRYNPENQVQWHERKEDNPLPDRQSQQKLLVRALKIFQRPATKTYWISGHGK